MNTDAGSVNQLSASVESLTAALISSEHRHRSLERMFRWGGIAFVGFAAVVFYIVSLALRAVPVMATEMQRMSASIQSMTYSVGSTMGRAGSWMPW